jgi:hypothetical protein
MRWKTDIIGTRAAGIDEDAFVQTGFVDTPYEYAGRCGRAADVAPANKRTAFFTSFLFRYTLKAASGKHVVSVLKYLVRRSYKFHAHETSRHATSAFRRLYNRADGRR